MTDDLLLGLILLIGVILMNRNMFHSKTDKRKKD